MSDEVLQARIRELEAELMQERAARAMALLAQEREDVRFRLIVETYAGNLEHTADELANLAKEVEADLLVRAEALRVRARQALHMLNEQTPAARRQLAWAVSE